MTQGPSDSLHQPDSELWAKHFCPQCKTVNWTSVGDEHHDSTEICTCRNCEFQYWLMSKSLVIDIYGNTAIGESGARIETGKANP